MKSKKNIEDILFEKKKISDGQLNQIKQNMARTKDPAEKVIIDMKLCTEEEIAEAMSRELGIPYVDLKNFIIDPQAIGTLDEKTARRLKVLPLYAVKDTLTVAMMDPQDIIARDEVKIVSKHNNIQPVMATKSSILEGIDQNYALGNTLEDIVKPLETKGTVFAPSAVVPPKVLSNLAGQPPVIKFVNQMIFDALKQRASDIHIEPLQEETRVRFRIDGVLQTAVSIPRRMHLPVVPRVKILAGMDIAESRKPQDGRFSVSVAGRQIDLRIATFPTAYGESVSIRLLDKSTAVLDIEELGLAEGVFKTFKRLIKSTRGILLITGPTGCGKTTTLYAILSRISSPEKNILTIEDPIEYTLENVTQSQVNVRIGLDFTSALRSFLRQDPDVIMVGEVRDNETAEMAFRAALTGHLVLSTLHTNDAPTAITRLKDIGIDATMLSTSILCVLAQRLVRLICPSCKEAYCPDKSVFEDLGFEFDPKVKYYKGKGCDECHSTGYRGRAGLFELMEFTASIKALIQQGKTLEEIRGALKKAGMKTLKEDGLDKVKRGMTTIEEVARVTQD